MSFYTYLARLATWKFFKGKDVSGRGGRGKDTGMERRGRDEEKEERERRMGQCWGLLRILISSELPVTFSMTSSIVVLMPRRNRHKVLYLISRL